MVIMVACLIGALAIAVVMLWNFAPVIIITFIWAAVMTGLGGLIYAIRESRKRKKNA